MLGDHMRHFVRQHRGDFGRVIGECDQAARHVKLTTRQSKRIDCRRIQDRNAITLVRPLGRGDQFLNGLANQAIQALVFVDAIICGQNSLMLPRQRRYGWSGLRGGFGRLRQGDLPVRSGRRNAAAEHEGKRNHCRPRHGLACGWSP